MTSRSNPSASYLAAAKRAVADLPWQRTAVVGAISVGYAALGSAVGENQKVQAALGLGLGAAGGTVLRAKGVGGIPLLIADALFIGGALTGIGVAYRAIVGPAPSADPRGVYDYPFCAPDQRRTNLGPPPSYLRVEAEVCGAGSSFASRELFVAYFFERLLSLGLPAQLAFEVTAHLAKETGFGRYYQGNNFGGWKTTADWARAFERRFGRPAPWWRAEGHLASGDQPTVFYRAYPSIEAFLLDWIDRFIPRPGTAPGAKYEETGRLAWSGGNWYRELMLQGYSGPNREADPDPAVEQLAGLARQARALYGQYKLGRTPASLSLDEADRQAVLAAQASLGVPATGTVDDATAVAMARATGGITSTRASGLLTYDAEESEFSPYALAA